VDTGFFLYLFWLGKWDKWDMTDFHIAQKPSYENLPIQNSSTIFPDDPMFALNSGANCEGCDNTIPASCNALQVQQDNLHNNFSCCHLI